MRALAVGEQSTLAKERVLRLGYSLIEGFSGPSPFMLIELGESVKAINTELRERKIIVADAESWNLPQYLRVSYGREEENQAFLSRVVDVDTNSSSNRFNRERASEFVATVDRNRLAQHDLTNPETTHSAEDMLKGRFGIDLEAGDVIDEKLMNPDHYAIPRKRQRGMDGKNEDW